MNKPLYPVSLPDGLWDEINKIKEENIVFETVHDTKYDGKYNVIVEFDTRIMKTYAFYRELLSKPQDRITEPEDILYNLLPAMIKKIRVWKIWEDYHKNLKSLDSSELLRERPRTVEEPFTYITGETTNEADGTYVLSTENASARAEIPSGELQVEAERVLAAEVSFHDEVDRYVGQYESNNGGG